MDMSVCSLRRRELDMDSVKKALLENGCTPDHIPSVIELANIRRKEDFDVVVEIRDSHDRLVYISFMGSWFDGEITYMDNVDGGVPPCGLVELEPLLGEVSYDVLVHYDVQSIYAGIQSLIVIFDDNDEENGRYWVEEHIDDEIDFGHFTVNGVKMQSIPYNWVAEGKIP